MTSSELAAVFVVVGAPLALMARWFVQWQRGTLEWRTEVPLIAVGAGAALLAVGISASGPVAQQVVPAVIISLSGVGLFVVTRRRPTASGVRIAAAVAILGGILLLIRSVLFVSGLIGTP